MSTVLVEQDGPVTTLRINRPEKRNALDRDTILRLVAELEAASARETTRVVVLAGTPTAFSTGADLNAYVGYGPVEVRAANRETWMRLFETIEALPEPVVASVAGYAVAGGTELLLACDLVVAADDATFGLAEARVGVIPGAGAAVRLTRWVGRAAAKEILMLGNPFGAAEAHRLGLVNRLVAAEELGAATAALAHELASRSPSALAAAKRAVNVGSEMELRAGIDYVLQEFALLFAGADQAEGMSAFLEKRPPAFTGR